MQDGVGRIGIVEVEFCEKKKEKEFIESFLVMKMAILLSGHGKVTITGYGMILHGRFGVPNGKLEKQRKYLLNPVL